MLKNHIDYTEWGGDEFIAIGKGKSEKDAEQFIINARLALKNTPYMASFGYSMYSTDDHVDDILNLADAMMYEDKQHYKHRAVEREY